MARGRSKGRNGQIKRLILLLCVLLVASPAAAQPEEKLVEDWDFVVAPYFWLPAMSGSMTIKGRQAELNTSVSDLFTETDFVFALQAQMEAWYKQRFGFIFNGQWTWLNQDDNTIQGPSPPFPGAPGLSLNFDIKNNLGLFEFIGAYRAGAWELGSGASSPVFTLDPLVGLRLTTLHSSFEPDGLRDLKASVDWVDPILGARMHLAFGNERRWFARFRGDFGGFGAGSDWTWNLVGMGGYEWHFKRHSLGAFVGARALYQDYNRGSGFEFFEWKVTQYGPLLGLSFKF